MRTALGVAVAGAVGALARYGIDLRIRQHGLFPWSTFVVNVTGAFVLGLVFALFVERSSLPDWVRTALTIGLLGAYTTFSTFCYETLRLIEGRAYGMAMLNAFGGIALGVAAVFAGMWLGRAMAG
jgi:CrcB protein